MLSRVFIQTSTIQIYIFGFLKHQIKTAVHKNGLRFYLVSFYSHSLLLDVFLTNLLMRFSSEYWYSFHYSDSRGYLIFCCHSVAKLLSPIYTPSFSMFNQSFLNSSTTLSYSGSSILITLSVPLRISLFTVTASLTFQPCSKVISCFLANSSI